MAKQQIVSGANSASHIVPTRYEQLITLGASTVSILTPVGGMLSGASSQAIFAMAIASFALLSCASIILTGKNNLLARLCLALGVIIIVVFAISHFYLGSSQSAETAQGPGVTEVKPPIMTVEAWIDKPMLDRSPDGSIVNTPGDGKKGWSERYITPVEVWTPDRPNAELLRRIPGYFNSFEPGETVYASVCGIEVAMQTYPRGDKRYTDQMTFSIPIPDSAGESCSR